MRECGPDGGRSAWRKRRARARRRPSTGRDQRARYGRGRHRPARRRRRAGTGSTRPRLSRGRSCRSRRSTGCSSNGEFGPAAGRPDVRDHQPGHRGAAGARSRWRAAADVDRAVGAARTAYEQVWGPMPGAERAKYLYRIARILQERSREFAVLESIDNGKPIKETRDVDIPLAAAHFFYYAGWADKLELRGLRARSAAARRGRAGDPVELPAADGGVEAGARAGRRATPAC